MSRLIDADKLKQHYAWWENGTAEMTLAEAKRNFDVIIDVQPTVEAVPTDFHDKCMQIEIEKRFESELKEKHGHWEEFHCSVCGKMGWDNEDAYCPNCGAKMDEVEDADN